MIVIHLGAFYWWSFTWVSFYWLSFYCVPFSWVSLFWLSFTWVSLYWLPFSWVSCHSSECHSDKSHSAKCRHSKCHVSRPVVVFTLPIKTLGKLQLSGVNVKKLWFRHRWQNKLECLSPRIIFLGCLLLFVNDIEAYTNLEPYFKCKPRSLLKIPGIVEKNCEVKRP